MAEDMGVHQIDRLVELLTSSECGDLLAALSSPEENVFQHLKRLLPENNRLDLPARARRDASDADGKETHLNGERGTVTYDASSSEGMTP